MPFNIDEYTDCYRGLYGEVVDCDVYGLKDISFTPDVIFDIGANIGIFTRFARLTYPNATIVAVEPNPENCERWRRDVQDDGKTHLLQAAI